MPHFEDFHLTPAEVADVEQAVGQGRSDGPPDLIDVFEKGERAVGESIREQRIRSDMSQSELAQRMRERGFGTQQSTVAKIESGGRPLRLSEVFAFADCLGIPWLALMVGRAHEHDLTPLERLQGELAEMEQRQTEIVEDMKQTLAHRAESYAFWSARSLQLAEVIRRKAASDKRGDSEPALPGLIGIPRPSDDGAS